MILTSDIINDLKASLDAEGSDRYTDAQDYIPAINRAMDHIIAVLNKAFAEDKLTEENLRELISIQLYQLSDQSTLTFSAEDLEEIWSVYAIYPKPRTIPLVITPLASSGSSQKLNDAKFLGGDKSAKRRTLEEWNDVEGNPFESGNTIVTSGDLVEYGYLSFASQDTTIIMVRPDIKNSVCAVAFLKYPPRITASADSIPLPAVLRNMLSSTALHFISVKQGDGTTLNQITDKELKELTELFT